MEYVAWIFGFLGFIGFIEAMELKKKVNSLEAALAKMEGSPLYEERRDLIRAAGSYIGRQVKLELKEDYMDADVVTYGNTKYGTNTILDMDDDWMLVRITGPKGSKDKLIRLEAIERISEVQ